MTNPQAMPEVSVVMGVYNGAARLQATLDSVLSQEGVDFEFVVVDDGSTDATGAMLERQAGRDSRLRVVHQANAGLTRALAAGCAQAAGRYIARQDCGDVSLPGRLARQCALLDARPDAAMVAGAVRYVAPAGEPLYTLRRPGDRLHEGLAALSVQRIEGPPHHGATMFRRELYERVGGYRAPFAVAQDLDLWLRFAEHGRCVGEEDVAYEAHLSPDSISARRRQDQLQLADLAIRCALARRAGLGDAALLAAAPALAPRSSGPVRGLERARFYYFVGSCLRQTDAASARRYFRRALRAYPLHLLAWARAITG
ncbi:glycosyltransferase family 2 protein [Caenimonas aquaedulcis]|uniref:Glycosyltransferase n=1 Tax=Caenimonas aquaedulcis TaxID=2793270 RepID=A0A931H5Y2_9BURK|nr:glycosyltransferase [Caenimonas aquaedulcis]MBG9389062.1 glycosyltransferase [Caenimonas aquaedulcis]